MSTVSERKALYEAQMAAYVRDANGALPAGWRIKATIRRSYPMRNRWRFDAIRDGQLQGYWEAYQVVATLAVIVKWIEAQPVPVVLTTDADGWVRSIEDIPA